jgi:hypothetical protein
VRVVHPRLILFPASGTLRIPRRVLPPIVKKSTGYGVFIMEQHSQQLDRRHLFAS